MFGDKTKCFFLLKLKIQVNPLVLISKIYRIFFTVTIPSSKNQKANLPKRNSAHGPDDRNPDLIPLSKGKYLNFGFYFK